MIEAIGRQEALLVEPRAEEPLQEGSAGSCLNCGAARTGVYCAHCGQRVMAGRHTLGRVLLSGLRGSVLNLERGLFHTAHRLTVAPESVLRDYLAGRTLPYTHPLAYLLLTFGAFAVLATLTGAVTGASGSDNRYFTALLIPCVAAASRLVFARARLTYTEHLVVAMYLCGHMALILTALQLAIPVLKPVFLVNPATGLLFVGFAAFLAVGHFAWSYGRFFSRRPLLAAAGALAVLVGGGALWLPVMTAVVSFFRLVR